MALTAPPYINVEKIDGTQLQLMSRSDTNIKIATAIVGLVLELIPTSVHKNPTVRFSMTDRVHMVRGTLLMDPT